MKKTDLDIYRDFFQKQGHSTKTYTNEDDLSKWWILEISYNDKINGAFRFDYKTESFIK